MSSYSAALAAYLKATSQQELAKAVGCSQGAISRYKSKRLPPREIAEKIDEATNGCVPLSLWIAAATEKFGLAA